MKTLTSATTLFSRTSILTRDSQPISTSKTPILTFHRLKLSDKFKSLKTPLSAASSVMRAGSSPTPFKVGIKTSITGSRKVSVMCYAAEFNHLKRASIRINSTNVSGNSLKRTLTATTNVTSFSTMRQGGSTGKSRDTSCQCRSSR